jgi:hypothetical protein
VKQKKVKNEAKQRRHRLIVSLVGVMGVLLVAGLLLSMNRSSRTALLSNQSIYDGFALTSTALIGQLTVSALNHEMTLVNDDGTRAEIASTATELLGKMTQNAESVIMTQEALGIETNTPDPTLVMRATEIVVTANAVTHEEMQDAMLLTDVAEGVSTFTPFDKVVDDWTVKIEERLGFSHPELDAFVVKLLSQYESDLETLNLVNLSALVQGHKTTDTDYMTVMMNVTSQSSYDSELLVFEFRNELVELLFQHTTGEFLSDLSGGILSDFNQNGQLNFAVSYPNLDDCPTSWLSVLEIHEDRVHDISPPLDEQRTYIGFLNKTCRIS